MAHITLAEVVKFKCVLRTRIHKLEEDTNRLSNLINAKNYSVTLAFDDTRYF